MTVSTEVIPETTPEVTPETTPETTQEVIILESEFQGGMLTDGIRSMVGIPPKGFEFVEYAAGTAVLIILFALVVSVFVGFSKMLGAK